jgi:hypothetical protein
MDLGVNPNHPVVTLMEILADAWRIEVSTRITAQGREIGTKILRVCLAAKLPIQNRSGLPQRRHADGDVTGQSFDQRDVALGDIGSIDRRHEISHADGRKYPVVVDDRHRDRSR